MLQMPVWHCLVWRPKHECKEHGWFQRNRTAVLTLLSTKRSLFHQGYFYHILSRSSSLESGNKKSFSLELLCKKTLLKYIFSKGSNIELSLVYIFCGSLISKFFILRQHFRVKRYLVFFIITVEKSNCFFQIPFTWIVFLFCLVFMSAFICR